MKEDIQKCTDIEEEFPVEQAWLDEIEKRCSDIDNGHIELISGEKGFARLQELFS